MSDANRGNLLVTEELVLGQVPGSPACHEFRFSSENLAHESEQIEDDELRDDREVEDLVEVGVSAVGTINTGPYFANYDTLMAAAMGSTFGPNGGTKVDKDQALSAVAATQKIVRATGSWVADGFALNQWVRTRGWTNAVNNGLFKVSAVTATDLTLTSGTGALLDEAAGKNRVVQGLFGTSCVAGVNIGATGPDQLTRASGSFITDGFRVGQRVRVIGFTTNPTNNNIWEITAVAALALTVVPISGVVTLVTEAAAAGRAIFGDHCRNGVLQRSFDFERGLLDTASYWVYRGARIGKMAFEIASRKLATLAYTILGTKGVSSGSSVAATVTPANRSKRIVAGVNVGVVKEGGVALTNAIEQLSFEVENNLEGVPTVTQKEFFEIGYGSCVIKGNARLYFKDLTQYQKYENQTESSLEYIIKDVEGNAYGVRWPRTKYTSDMKPVIPGKNQRIWIDCGFQALHSDDFNCQMMLDRIPA